MTCLTCALRVWQDEAARVAAAQAQVEATRAAAAASLQQMGSNRYGASGVAVHSPPAYAYAGGGSGGGNGGESPAQLGSPPSGLGPRLGIDLPGGIGGGQPRRVPGGQ